MNESVSFSFVSVTYGRVNLTKRACTVRRQAVARKPKSSPSHTYPYPSTDSTRAHLTRRFRHRHRPPAGRTTTCSFRVSGPSSTRRSVRVRKASAVVVQFSRVPDRPPKIRTYLPTRGYGVRRTYIT